MTSRPARSLRPAGANPIGLIGPSQALARNREPKTALWRDLALVGRIPEGLVIAIRGTQPPRITLKLAIGLGIGKDWLNDADIVGGKSEKFGGFVHQGFADAATDLYQDNGFDHGILRRVKDLAAAHGAGRVIVTGHSKGGPVAQLVAYLLKQEAGFRNTSIEIVTFAAARLGNENFKQDFDAAGIACLRYETCHDLVPHLPMGGDFDANRLELVRALRLSVPEVTLGFVPLGDVIKETPAEADAWRNGPDLSLLARFSMFTRIRSFAFPLVHDVVRTINAHSIAPGSHYDNLVKTHATP